MSPNQMEIKQALKIYSAVTLLLIVTAMLLGGLQQAVSALLGSMILVVSAGTLLWSVLQAYGKKSFALAGIVIVIKYLLLAAGLYWVCTQAWVSLAWLAAGVGSALLATVFYGLRWQARNIN